MFKKVLVANRGEIAVRVLRACKELGIPTVAVYSEGDTESLHIQLADESVCIGPAPSAKSYLVIDNVIKAALETGADAIHPGYGYLSENSEFARICEEKNLTFIGPSAQTIDDSGDKINAKRLMRKAGVPLIPSSEGGISDTEEAIKIAGDIGYPIMIKASGGGGGRGIRICADEEALCEELPVARREALISCGNDEVFIEKCVVRPRHIEFQILADSDGNVIHLGERECSIQRRFQKLIEESPSMALTPELRKQMGDAAITAAKAVNYCNAGTVEFLLDQDKNFYFIEINSRIQVEHPVTEMVTGVDLLKEQLRIAAGGKLTYTFEDLPVRGWSIECRINAENPDFNFMPCPGTLEKCHLPSGFGVRVDTHLYQGYSLPIYYDSMIAKLITFGPSREAATQTMRRALDELDLTPLKTTQSLHRKIMDDDDFINGDIDTAYILKFVPEDDDDDD